MKLQNLVEGDDWSVWFDSRESYAGKSKVIGFTRRGSYNQVLVDLHYKDGKSQITADQFVSVVKKNANLQKSVAKKIADDINEHGFDYIKGKKY